MSHQPPQHAPSPGVAHRRTTTSIALSLLGTLAVVAALVVPTTATAAPPAPTPQADAALGWLGAQLAAHGDTMPASFGPGTDWGLTMDAVLAHVAAGRSSDPQAVATTDVIALPATVEAYTTWTSGADTVTDAGATGKTLLTLRSMGRSSIVGGTDLETVLRGLIETSGVHAGRFSDDVPDPAWNASNGFGQALSMLGLSLTSGGVPTAAVDFLVAQQCPAGGFRLSYDAAAGCTDDGQADTDATGLSLQALLSVPRTPAVQSSLERGITWLLAIQQSDGSFAGTGPTASPNANSSGIIAQFLRAAGATSAADRAADSITGLQLTPTNTAGTPAAGQQGAIAYDGAGFAAALADGITAQMGDQWRRATAQAVLALGLSPYGLQDVDPVTTTSATSSASTSTSTTAPASTTTIDPASTTTAITPTSAPVPSTTRSDGTAAEVDSLGTGRGGAGSTTPSSTAGAARLATTGGDAAPLLMAGAALVLAGMVLAVGSVRGRRLGSGR